jgi:hypothetical protein
MRANLAPPDRLMPMTVVFFPRKTSNHRWNAVRELKEHARTAINADEETIVTISERDCGDPGCGGARTIVLIMHPRRPTEAVGIDKPLEQITQTDLSDALAPLAARTGLSEASVETEMTIAPARPSTLVEPH